MIGGKQLLHSTFYILQFIFQVVRNPLPRSSSIQTLYFKRIKTIVMEKFMLIFHGGMNPRFQSGRDAGEYGKMDGLD
jgi:hypothetical protein